MPEQRAIAEIALVSLKQRQKTTSIMRLWWHGRAGDFTQRRK
jgi:hypothetical protein